jgi:hypothetical protein
MLTTRNKSWLLHIERGDKVILREAIDESNRLNGSKSKYTFEQLNKVIKTGEGNMRIIGIIDAYFKEKIEKKNSTKW